MKLEAFVAPIKCSIPDGAIGVWQIPEHNIVIPVYRPSVNTGAAAQEIIDREHAATIRKWGAGQIIEDHAGSQSTNGRGIWNVGTFTPDTVGFLVTERRTERYVCNRVLRAVRHTTCYTVDGIGVTTRSAKDILCVSCATTDASEVYIAAFKYKGEVGTV